MRRTWVLLAILSALLTGCGHFTDTIPLLEERDEVALYGRRTVGQTFTCHHAGLTSISVLLRASEGSGEIVLHLRESADSLADLATSAISPPPRSEAAYHSFSIPLQDDVNGVSFYLLLEAPEATAESPVWVPYSSTPAVRDDLLLDGVTVPGRLSYRLSYSNLHIAKDLVGQVSSFGLQSLWLLLLTVPFYLLPGGAAVVWLLREGDWVERIIVALGLSVAIYALLMYATMTGLRLGRGATLGFLGICAALIGLRVWLDWRRGKRWRAPSVREVWGSIQQDPSVAVLGFVFALVLGVRIWVTKDMVAPRWGDSYQHTVIAQLMVDNGGLFESWEPYAPYTGLTTHFGFHANVAFFCWLSDDSVIHSVIWVGQMLNALAVLGLYPLGKRMGGRWAGTLAVLVGGLLLPTPMAYMNWGRYPQLTGAVALVITGWLTWMILESRQFSWRLVVLGAVAALGQVFGYYRMPYYFVLFVGALLVCVFLPKHKLRWHLWRRVFLHGLATGALVIAVLVPWALSTAQGQLGTMAVRGVSDSMQMDQVLAQFRIWSTIRIHVPTIYLVFVAAALFWAVLSRTGTSLAVVLWAFGLFAVNAARLFAIPGAVFLDAFASMISLYMPVSLLIGWLGAVGVSALLKRSAYWNGPISGVVLLISLLGLVGVSRVPDVRYDLVKAGDMEAMAWIRDNTSPESRFLVNGFRIYGNTSIVGSDAGWWIPLLTRRENTMPPQYALLTAEETDPGYGKRMLDLVSGLRHTGISTQEGLSLLCQNGVTHVYIGQGEGKAAVPPSEPLFLAQEMLSSTAFNPVYHQGKVWVFQLNTRCRTGTE